MGDGLLSFCKDCVRKRVSAHRSANIDAVRAYDRARGKDPARRAGVSRVSLKWRMSDPRRAAAHRAVYRAVSNGSMAKKPCEVCGSKKSVAHHPDYDKPLHVVWLCQAHHKQEHARMADAMMKARGER